MFDGVDQAIVAHECNKLRTFNMDDDGVHYAHQAFVSLLWKALFALTGEKDYKVLQAQVLEAIEQYAPKSQGS